MCEENMTVTEDFSRVENTYQMEAEVCIVFSDFGKMQNVCNLLIEKLGTSVTISPPHFYHTPEAIDTLRIVPGARIKLNQLQLTVLEMSEVYHLKGIYTGTWKSGQ
ncbi:interleukin-1 receptor-associated kinase 1-binding protein 1 isoform X2 [Athene cunicularia]|uniref:interleukin-1 receptor-associated kinase 1-binding protein 1 isoform X2 n=1 Tax=Athene cunicularia TaxID=194338 RepID=UPI000EF66DC4|nr:interleukin-1 receptor-associated kinase 1-binding protein 1 isoform X2 [Athene cunicularia]